MSTTLTIKGRVTIPKRIRDASWACILAGRWTLLSTRTAKW